MPTRSYATCDRTPLPVAAPCHVVSVDDWGLRRGQTYGAILVDLERHRVVDLLPDREADTFAAWLQDQPQIRVISRDRGANFADVLTRGAPQAVQVAIRYHLLQSAIRWQRNWSVRPGGCRILSSAG